MKGKLLYFVLIGLDIALTGLNHFWANSDVNTQYYVFDVTAAIRHCLLPIAMLIRAKLDKWSELLIVNYLTFDFLDVIQEVQMKNNGVQAEELVAFIVVTFIMVFRWKQTP